MKLSNQAKAVLEILKQWTLSGVATYRIASDTNIPKPSIRRAISELKSKGFQIKREKNTLYNEWRLYLVSQPSWALN